MHRLGLVRIKLAAALVSLGGFTMQGHLSYAQEAGSGEPICPLSEEQEKRALKVFKDGITPIFRIDRCSNCHGGVNPYSKQGGHAGNAFDFKETLREFVKSKRLQAGVLKGSRLREETDAQFRQRALKETATLEQKAKAILDGPEDVPTEAVDRFFEFQICSECHNRVTGGGRERSSTAWVLPIERNFFTNKDEKGLCMNMQKFFQETASGEEAAQAFVAHLRIGVDGFQNESFKGTRGLNPRGEVFYDDFVGGKNGRPKTFQLEPPPPGTDIGLQIFAQDWVEALGGKFRKKPPDCGCVPHRYQLKIRQRWTVNLIGRNLESEVEVPVDLKFHKDGSITGEASVRRELQEHLSTLGTTCEASANGFETWKLVAKLDEESGQMRMKLAFNRSAMLGGGICRSRVGAEGHELKTAPIKSDDVRTPLDNLEMPARVGEKRSLEFRLGPGRNTLDLSLIEVSP